MPRVAVVVLTHESAEDVERCLSSVRRAIDGRADVALWVVDNASTDGTPGRVREAAPGARLFETPTNLGYAGGMNVALREAMDGGFDFVFLLNPDTEVDPAFLDEAVAVAEAEPAVAAVQSLLLLDPERDRIDSAGNAIQFLGFGYCRGHRAPRSEAPESPAPIHFASGAAMLLRLDALRTVGLFDEELFLYLEDLDLGWRLALAGWESRLAPRSVVFHRHEFTRSPQKHFLLERNRWLVLSKNLAPRSKWVLYPWLFAAEIGLAVVAAGQGWLPQKARAWRALLSPSLRRRRRRLRAEVAATRKRPDRAVVRSFEAGLEQEGVTGPVVRRLVNPGLRLLWSVLRRAV